MVKGGDQNGQGLKMVHANIELVLQHPGTLIAHARQRLPPLLNGLRVHEPKYPQRAQKPANYPQEEKFSPPCLSDPLRTEVMAVDVILPPSHRHLFGQIKQELGLVVEETRPLLHYLGINEPVHGDTREQPPT